MKVFTAERMRAFDKAATEKYGIPSIVLMENAALRVVEFLEAKFAPLADKSVTILCGKGNNGGDGLAIARHLSPLVNNIFLIHAAPDEYKGDSAVNFRAIEAKPRISNVLLIDWSQIKTEEDIATYISDFDYGDIIIDAFLGTGMNGPLRFPLDDVLTPLVAARHIVSVDIASGLSADDGQNYSPWFDTDFTVTFAAPKRGFFVRNGLDCSGEIWVGDIGTRPVQMAETATGIETLDLESTKTLLPHRPIDAHKGDAGRVLICGGSTGMSGAVAIASRAALKVGCGLCLATVPEAILNQFAVSCLEATSKPLPCNEKGQLLPDALETLAHEWEKMQVVALGPGIGRDEATFEFIRQVVEKCLQPLIIDADALYALTAIAEAVRKRQAPTILTPHPGEMGELMGLSASEVNENRFEIVADCAQKYGAIVVLKGARTLLATPAGKIFVNLTGNPGMATGGSGDALTGTIAGLLAQLKDAEAATKLGVYVHGYAGDIAARTLGNGLTAVDIVSHLPLAIEEIKIREPERINGRLRRLE